MSYTYAKIRDRKLYQKMTGIVRGSNLLGKCLSSSFAQIAISYLHIEYGILVYVSLAGKKFIQLTNFDFNKILVISFKINCISGSIVAFTVTFFLPPVKSYIYFHPESPETTKPKVNNNTFYNQYHKIIIYNDNNK